MAWRKQQFWYPTLIGCLLGSGYIVPALWFVGLIGVAWCSVYLIRSPHATWRTAWYIWWVKALCFTSWLRAIYPIDWLGVPLGIYELPLIAFYWMTVAGALGFGGVALFYLLRLASRVRTTRFVYVLLPLLWLFAELLSSLAFSILLYGPGGTIGTTFTMGYIGYLLAGHEPLLLLAEWGGVYVLGITYVGLAVVGIWLYKRHRYAAGAALVLLVATSPFGPATPEPQDTDQVVAVVDTFLTETDWSSDTGVATHEAQWAALRSAQSYNPDYIIFPEDSRLFDQSVESDVLESYLNFTFGTSTAVVVDSSRARYEDETIMQAAIYDGSTRALYQSHKRYLVPQGEFMPYVYRFLFSLFETNDATTVLDGRLAYTVGPQTSQAHFANHIPGVLFCFEVVDARGVQKILAEREEQPPFIAHIISHAWIHDSEIFRRQLTSMLRVQALWGDIALVTAGNHAPGEVIYRNGSVQSLTPVATLGSTTLSLVTVPVQTN